jgi:hypothetical protein
MTLRDRQKHAELKALAADLSRPRVPRASRASRSRLGLGYAVWCARELIGKRAVRAVVTGRAGAAASDTRHRHDESGFASSGITNNAARKKSCSVEEQDPFARPLIVDLI